jgi:hypothetical protein
MISIGILRKSNPRKLLTRNCDHWRCMRIKNMVNGFDIQTATGTSYDMITNYLQPSLYCLPSIVSSIVSSVCQVCQVFVRWLSGVCQVLVRYLSGICQVFVSFFSIYLLLVRCVRCLSGVFQVCVRCSSSIYAFCQHTLALKLNHIIEF